MSIRRDTDQPGGMMDEFLTELLASAPLSGKRGGEAGIQPAAPVEEVVAEIGRAGIQPAAPVEEVAAEIGGAGIQPAAPVEEVVAEIGGAGIQPATPVEEVVAQIGGAGIQPAAPACGRMDSQLLTVAEAIGEPEVRSLTVAALNVEPAAAMKVAPVPAMKVDPVAAMNVVPEDRSLTVAALNEERQATSNDGLPHREETAPIGLDKLIAAIDGEIASVPRPKFEAAIDPATRSKGDHKKNCILFSLDQGRYAVSLGNVVEMDKIPRITPIPNVPDFVRGVTNLRGEILCVLDLRVLLGFAPSEHLDRGRILVVRASGGHATAALVVDDVRGIATIPLDKLKPPAGTIQDRVIPVLSGVCDYADSLLNVLSLEELFRMPEIRQLETN